ncbi:MAG: hypothetical protein KGD63_06865 [Candidatus Lokiarchaeota archaeon]|nr:hypothetical protein [Candidatus Lokiarchaeota archaeon]
MEKQDLIHFIIDNVSVFNLNLPEELKEYLKFETYLVSFNENILNIIAGFNEYLLSHFLNSLISKNKEETLIDLKKMEKISHFIGPTGNLYYLLPEQINYILDQLDNFKLDDINEDKINLIADELLQKEFGNDDMGYTQNQALENQIYSAQFYLKQIGYSLKEINERIEIVRKDPLKINELFNLPPKEIINLPPELQGSSSISGQNLDDGEEDLTEEGQAIIDQHIQSIQHEISNERVQKVNKILDEIKLHVKDKMTDNYEKVFKQLHPDRLQRALNFLKETKRKDKRMDSYLDWFFSTHLLENIEFKVEHWQISTHASHGAAGVYTAGVSFSRYDKIIKGFSDSKLLKIVKIARRLLQNPSKKKIQKLGQDLIAETGFDEHLYFTD